MIDDRCFYKTIFVVFYGYGNGVQVVSSTTLVILKFLRRRANLICSPAIYIFCPDFPHDLFLIICFVCIYHQQSLLSSPSLKDIVIDTERGRNSAPFFI